MPIQWLSDKLPAMESALAALVDINSFTDHPAGGRAVGARLVELFAAAGLSARTVPSTRFADHLVFTTAGYDPARPPIALVGHHDTVFPPATFEGYRQDGALARGPGVLDMKGGLVVVAFALRALAETVGTGKLPAVRVVSVADEEVGSPEGKRVIEDAIGGAGACLVFEAGRAGDAIITRRKGTGAITALAHGKAAHAGVNPAAGVNAIWALARFIDRVQRLSDPNRGVSVNVGTVTGGTSKNTVPDRASCVLDLRFTSRASGEELLAAIHGAAAAAAEDVPGARLELSGGLSRMPLERTDASAALLAEYGACAQSVGLGASEAGLIGGGSDASTSSAMGIPTIDGLGPRGSGFHTHDEHIEVATLVTKAQALAAFILGRAGA